MREGFTFVLRQAQHDNLRKLFAVGKLSWPAHCRGRATSFDEKKQYLAQRFYERSKKMKTGNKSRQQVGFCAPCWFLAFF